MKSYRVYVDLSYEVNVLADTKKQAADMAVEMIEQGVYDCQTSEAVNAVEEEK